MKTYVLFVSFFAFPLAYAKAEDRSLNPLIPAFHQVSEGIYRGGRPSELGIEELSQLGVKTIIDLETDAAIIAREKRDSARFGIRLISKPMHGFRAPENKM